MSLSPHVTFRPPRPRILIVGCGDIGMRLLPLLRERFRVFVLTRTLERCAALRASGATPLLGDLDQPHTLKRLGALAQNVIHLAPPPSSGARDTRTRHLTAILPAGANLVYVSTTGVYGDCQGAYFDETRPVAPATDRARRRVDAEQCLRGWARRRRGRVMILRVPGIYADDRLPLERLTRQTPALLPDEDVYTNHIHAEDLAAITLAAYWRGRALRCYHTVDDSVLKMGEYFDLVADAHGMPRPPRLGRSELVQHISPAMLSFMQESRRLDNRRLKMELGYRLHYPDVQSVLGGRVSQTDKRRK